MYIFIIKIEIFYRKFKNNKILQINKRFFKEQEKWEKINFNKKSILIYLHTKK